MLRTMDAYPIRYHHLYNIHILVIISRRVVDAFGPVFSSSPSCLPPALPYPPLLYDSFISFLSLELGRRLRCRDQMAQVSRSFFFLFPSILTSYPTCMTSFFILCYKPSFPSPVNTHSYSCTLSPASTSACSRSPLAFTFSCLQLSYHLASCIKTPAPPVILSHLSSPFPLDVPF